MEIQKIMENYTKLLKNPLFDGLNEENIKKLYKCLSAREITIERDSYIFHAGDKVGSVYILMTGSMHIINEDFWGNRTIIETMQSHTLFGEAYALSSAKEHLTSVVAAEDSTLLEIDPACLFGKCLSMCLCHDILIYNTTRVLSEKIVRLTEKVEHIVQRSMREKILSYLSLCARKAKSTSFDIVYSRQQLADYLCVDRSALSHELQKLAAAGMLRYHKNHFELFTPVI